MEKEQSIHRHIADAINGLVVTNSDSDNPDDVINFDPISTKGKAIITKKRAALRRRATRLRAKLIAEQNFLGRKKSKRQSKILEECPDIGKTIEKFVSERNNVLKLLN